MPYLNKDQNKIHAPLGELSSEGMGFPFTTGIAFATMRDGSSSKKISEADGHTLSKQAKKLNKQGYCIKGIVSQNEESQVLSLGIEGSLSDLTDITKDLPVEPTIPIR